MTEAGTEAQHPPVQAGPLYPIEPPALRPVTEGERIASIDVIRGLALLGILVMNIQTFAMIEVAYMNPHLYGDLTGINYAIWLISHLFFDMKMMTIFSMLFGAGIVLMCERAAAMGRGAGGTHVMRMIILGFFGMLHGYLLWYGDILFPYSVCGLVAFLFWRLRAGWLLALGLLSLTIGWGLMTVFGLLLNSSIQGFEQAAEQMSTYWVPSAEMIQQELDAYRGSWLEQEPRRALSTLGMQTTAFIFLISWRAGGCMLLGMGLYKLGVFSARRSKRFYCTLAVIGFAVGLFFIAVGVKQRNDIDWEPITSFFILGGWNYWGSLLVALAWVSVISLIFLSAAGRKVTAPLAAVGRMAFTNYIMHTVICTTIFYGHGFGLFGSVERWQQILIVFAIWAFQLVASPLWLKYFQSGPLEWLWRSMTYGKLQPMRRVTA